ncbi:MAG TPA: hypothetical protein V6D14_27045 [Coleofasciculaceae cyanobacterium]|jgi:hypothetical protein
MNTELDNQQQNQSVGSVGALISTNSYSFDFDLWAREVRRQMLAVLQKKYSERDRNSNGKELE